MLLPGIIYTPLSKRVGYFIKENRFIIMSSLLSEEENIYTEKVRSNASAFHRNFSSGSFEKNGPLVTENIYVNSNNAVVIGRENFVKRIRRYKTPFPGLQMKDRIILVEGNIAAVH